jgi:peroxin-6
MNEEHRNKLISETLQGIAAVGDEVPFSHFQPKTLFPLFQCISCLCILTFQSIDDKFVRELAAQTSGFMPRDILALIADAGVSFAHKIAAEKDSKEFSNHEDILPESSSASQNEEKHFCKEHIMSSLERAKKRNRAALGTPKVSILILSVRTISRLPMNCL